MEVQDLKDSSKRIGQMYSILIDYNGYIIDGEHRLQANKEWKKVVLPNIKTEKDLLIARLCCNTIRRTVSCKEKTKLQHQLGEICLKEGIAAGKIAY